MTTTSTTPTAAPLAAEAPGAARPPRIVPVGRRLAVAGLVGATLNTAEAVLGQFLPERPEAVVDQLRGVAENSALFGVRAVVGTLAVPFMAVAFLAAARTLAPRAPARPRSPGRCCWRGCGASSACTS